MNNYVNLCFNNMLRILDLGFAITKNLYTHPNRKLDWNVFLYVAEGEMEVWEEETEYIVSSGQYLFLKRGFHHFGEAKTPASTKWYWIHFCDCSLNDSSQELSSYINSVQKLELSTDDYNKYINLPKYGAIKYQKTLEKKLDMMIEVYKSTSPFRAISLSIDTLQLFLSIYKDSTKDYKLTKSDTTIKKIIEFLEKKDNYSLNSKELESYLNMNYSYLCNIFKIKTGYTIHRYNSQIYINKATNMMRTSNMNISEISEKLGFNNPFYFNKVFRKVMSCSPSEYIHQIYRSEM